jgi:hypothetical protein
MAGLTPSSPINGIVSKGTSAQGRREAQVAHISRSGGGEPGAGVPPAG